MLERKKSRSFPVRYKRTYFLDNILGRITKKINLKCHVLTTKPRLYINIYYMVKNKIMLFNHSRKYLKQGLLFLEFNSKMTLGDQQSNFRTILKTGGFIV